MLRRGGQLATAMSNRPSQGRETAGQSPGFVLLDCGSRDIKFVRFQNGEVVDMGWNAECGASMGFTIERLATYYHLGYATIALLATGFSVTCGGHGMSYIFDAVIAGASEAEAVAIFVRGISLNAYHFAHEPGKLYLSLSGE